MTRQDGLRAAAPLILGVIFAITGHPLRAAVMVPIVILMAIPATGRPIWRSIRRASAGLAQALSFVLLGVVELLVVLPAWLWSRTLNRVLGWRQRAGSEWAVVPAGTARLTRRPFVRERPPATGGPIRRTLVAIPKVIGVIVLVMGADYGVGRGYDAWRGYSTASTAINDSVVQTLKTNDSHTPSPPDPRALLPQMKKYPFAIDLFRETSHTRGQYYPYLLYKPIDFQGQYVNISGWLRKSYEPPATGHAMPIVWFFGGSTTWGEGQRDEYTVASQFARVAEAAGHPVIVRNYGERGWDNWQETLLFEQLLSTNSERPDYVIFYDGINDYDVQQQLPVLQPSHYDVAKVAAASGFQVGPGNTLTTGQIWDQARKDYLYHSMVAKVVDKIRSFFTTPKPTPLAVPIYKVPAGTNLNKFADAVANIYQRGRQMATDMASHHNIKVFTFWQPMHQWEQNPTFIRAATEIGPPTVSLLHEFDGHQDVYIDGGHTNEDGSLLTAKALWKTMQTPVEAWYQQHP